MNTSFNRQQQMYTEFLQSKVHLNNPFEGHDLAGTAGISNMISRPSYHGGKSKKETRPATKSQMARAIGTVFEATSSEHLLGKDQNRSYSHLENPKAPADSTKLDQAVYLQSSSNLRKHLDSLSQLVKQKPKGIKVHFMKPKLSQTQTKPLTGL